MPLRERLVVGAWAFVGSVGAYLVIALISPLGISTGDWLTLDQRGRLELEGIALPYGLAVAAVVGSIACWRAVRKRAAPRAGATAIVFLVLMAIAFRMLTTVIETGPDDPVILPWALAAATFLIGAAARSVATLASGRRTEPTPAS